MDNPNMKSIFFLGIHLKFRHWQTDFLNTMIVLEFMEDRNPFSRDASLQNVAVGVTAVKSVNVDNVKRIEHQILNRMTCHKVDDYTFKNNEQAVTLGKDKF